MTVKEQLQANIEYDPKLQQQVPKEELEKIKMENAILERQIQEDLLQTEAGKAILLRAINEACYMMTKARIRNF